MHAPRIGFNDIDNNYVAVAAELSSPLHRTAATATFVWPMSLKPTFWQHVVWPESRFAYNTDEKSNKKRAFRAGDKKGPNRIQKRP